mgnify:CR=1 FL=1
MIRSLVTLRIPMTVPRELLPNNVTSARTNNDRRRRFRRDIGLALKSQINKQRLTFNPPLFSGIVHCQLSFSWDKERTRGITGRMMYRKTCDGDNLIAAWKGGFDSLQDVGLIADDKYLIHHPPVQDKDIWGDGFTIIDLWEETEDE